MCLRRHFLPVPEDHSDEEPDGVVNLARASWLAEYFYERSVNSTAEGVAFAFNGKRG